MSPRRRPSSPTTASDASGSRRRVALLLALLLLGLAPASWAQSARERAKALFRQGSALFSKGDYQGALDRLEQAQRLYPSHKIEVSIGYALELLGRDLEAAERFERFLAAAQGRAAPRIVAEVEQKLRRLKRTLSRLSLNQALPRDLILVDGKEVARAPLAHPIYLRPGRHQLTVLRGERKLLDQALALEPGEHRLAMVVEPEAEVAPAAPRARPPARRRPFYKRWWLWTVVGGVVVGAVVVGAVAASSGGSERLPTGSLGTLDLTQ